jgi:hypothetical protein
LDEIPAGFERIRDCRGKVDPGHHLPTPERGAVAALGPVVLMPGTIMNEAG